MVADVRIERASTDDLDAVLALLEREHLPTAGLRDHFDAAIVARQHGRIVGSAALEIYPGGALLRSVAVDSGIRGVGIGHALTDTAIRLAADRQLDAVYLLTTTADGYFPKFGFERITRTDVPTAVQSSVEFTSACPASAIVMRKTLRA